MEAKNIANSEPQIEDLLTKTKAVADAVAKIADLIAKTKNISNAEAKIDDLFPQRPRSLQMVKPRNIEDLMALCSRSSP